MSESLDAEWSYLASESIRYVLEPDDFGFRSTFVDALQLGDVPDPLRPVLLAAKKLDSELNGGWESVDVVAEMTRAGEAGADLLVQSVLRSAHPPATAAQARRLLDQVESVRRRRAVRSLLTDAALRAQHDGVDDPGMVVDRVQADLAAAMQNASAWQVFDPYDLPVTASTDWCAHRLLVPGEALIVSAPPGIGKGVLLRQLAFTACNGLDPWEPSLTRVIHDQPTLILDFESHSHDIRSTLLNMAAAYQRATGHAPRVPLIHSARRRVNLRTGTVDAAALRGLLRDVRPRLVCMGPLKNLYDEAANETYASVALAVQDCLMRLMSEFGFAIAIEAHGSRQDTGQVAGSQRWQDWPDVSISLEPVDDEWAGRHAQTGTQTQRRIAAEYNERCRPEPHSRMARIVMRRESHRNPNASTPVAIRTGSSLLPWTGVW